MQVSVEHGVVLLPAKQALYIMTITLDSASDGGRGGQNKVYISTAYWRMQMSRILFHFNGQFKLRIVCAT